MGLLKGKIKFLLGKAVHKAKDFEDFYCLKVIQKKSGQNFFFVNQGNGGLTVSCPENLKMDSTSHFKSNSFIECSGGVTIGCYFHTGRGLTIFSSNHIYNNENFIPYDTVDKKSPVVIEDFVWCGANVTIMPGVTIGEGAVIGGGAVVAKDIPKYAVAVGNPARVVKYRDVEAFERLKQEGKFC